jgi:hypothetical protein
LVFLVFVWLCFSFFHVFHFTSCVGSIPLDLGGVKQGVLWQQQTKGLWGQLDGKGSEKLAK